MTEELIIEIMQKTIKTIALLTAPPLLTIIAVGLITQVIQNVTQLKDQALSFVPKIIITGIIMMLLAPWYLQTVQQYVEEIFTYVAASSK